MADSINEQLSALADGELEGEELERVLQRLKDDPELRARWSRYHLIRETLQGSRNARRADRLYQQVDRALSSEPVILAPRQSHWRLPSMVRQTGGVAALAASITAAVILGFQTLNAPEPGMPASLAGGLAPPAEEVQIADRRTDPAVEERLNPYLVNHHEFSSVSRMPGVLPYARIVSHSSDSQ